MHTSMRDTKLVITVFRRAVLPRLVKDKARQNQRQHEQERLASHQANRRRQLASPKNSTTIPSSGPRPSPISTTPPLRNQVLLHRRRRHVPTDFKTFRGWKRLLGKKLVLASAGGALEAPRSRGRPSLLRARRPLYGSYLYRRLGHVGDEGGDERGYGPRRLPGFLVILAGRKAYPRADLSRHFSQNTAVKRGIEYIVFTENMGREGGQAAGKWGA